MNEYNNKKQSYDNVEERYSDSFSGISKRCIIIDTQEGNASNDLLHKIIEKRKTFSEDIYLVKNEESKVLSNEQTKCFDKNTLSMIKKINSSKRDEILIPTFDDTTGGYNIFKTEQDDQNII